MTPIEQVKDAVLSGNTSIITNLVLVIVATVAIAAAIYLLPLAWKYVRKGFKGKQ
jgi:hypothetical protein